MQDKLNHLNNKIMDYNYTKEMSQTIYEWLNENSELLMAENPKDEIEEQIYDMLWDDDSITGNGSGSYTFNRRIAEENLAHNWALLSDAINELYYIRDISLKEFLTKGPEYWDVVIRCYLLGPILHQEINRWYDDNGITKK